MESNFNLLPPVLFGVDTSLKAGERLKGLGCTRVLAVYDQGVKKAGIPDKIIAGVKAAGIGVAVYEGVQADPPLHTLEECGETGRREKVDGVLAIGGGSTMDTAKAANLLLTNPSPIKQYAVRGGPAFKPGKVLVLIPTTSGTGSEVTSVAVLTDAEAKRKIGIGGPFVRGTLAIVDPLLTVGMPPSITADTGLDVLSHAIEAITAIQANPMSDTLGEKAIQLVMTYLPRAVKDGSDIDARTKMSFAATIAGWAFINSNTQLGHAFGHSLGSLYHIPHGNACGAALPEIMEFLSDAIPDRIRLVGTAMGLKTGAGVSAVKAGQMVRDALIDFNKKTGQKTLKQLNIKDSALPETARAIAGEFLVASSPKKPSEEDILKILQKAYSR
jgi:alcohol dehydrogenase